MKINLIIKNFFTEKNPYEKKIKKQSINYL